MKPLRNLVLLEPLKKPAESPGGIAYAMQYRDDATQWTVLAVGPGRRRKDGSLIPLQVRPGDGCLYNPGHGHRHRFDDGRVIVEAEQIQMVFPLPCDLP